MNLQLLSKIKFFIVTAALLSFVYLIWYSYRVYINHIPDEALPLIRAVKQVRFKPTDPGGIEILNLDKDIYEHITNKTNNDQIIVVEQNEKPVPRTQILKMIEAQLA